MKRIFTTLIVLICCLFVGCSKESNEQIKPASLFSGKYTIEINNYSCSDNKLLIEYAYKNQSGDKDSFNNDCEIKALQNGQYLIENISSSSDKKEQQIDPDSYIDLQNEYELIDNSPVTLEIYGAYIKASDDRDQKNGREIYYRTINIK